MIYFERGVPFSRRHRILVLNVRVLIFSSHQASISQYLLLKLTSWIYLAQRRRFDKAEPATERNVRLFEPRKIFDDREAGRL